MLTVRFFFVDVRSTNRTYFMKYFQKVFKTEDKVFTFISSYNTKSKYNVITDFKIL